MKARRFTDCAFEMLVRKDKSVYDRKPGTTAQHLVYDILGATMEEKSKPGAMIFLKIPWNTSQPTEWTLLWFVLMVPVIVCSLP